MNGYIPLDEHTRLITFTATARPGKSRVIVELECSDHNSFGYLLERLEEISKKQPSTGTRKRRPVPDLD